MRRVLHQVGLSNLATKRIRAMSGGQRRRIALAQALLGSPPVLILDEPTSGVDPEQRLTWRTVLAEMARTSIVVMSTHQTEDVATLCERVIVLDQGRVRYDGQVTELVRQAVGQPDPAATVSWRTGTGRYRNVAAHARDGVEHVESSPEDAYLLRGELPDSRPARTAALCMVAVVPFLCGVLAFFAFLHFHQVGVLGLVIYGWVNVATFGSLSHPDSAAFTALRLFSPFAFFTYMSNVADVTTWRGSPWFFIGWQLALCATAVLAAILLVLAAVGGFPHAVHA